MGKSKRQEKIKRPIAPLRVSVKFLEDCDPGRGNSVFKKGSVRELVISSANHWVRRGKAVRYVEKAKPAKAVGKSKSTKAAGKWKKVDVKAEPVVEETASEETADEEPAIEGKKTEDGESLGGIPDLMV